jgi:phosphoenolpyruvate carboxykinase (ATP)
VSIPNFGSRKPITTNLNLDPTMKQIGFTNPGIPIFKNHDLQIATLHANCHAQYLQKRSVATNEGIITHNGALSIKTGRFTGRAPRDRYIVKDDFTANSVDWNNINQPYDAPDYAILKNKMIMYAQGKELYLQDVAAGADENYRLNVRLLAEKPWSAQFANNMFIRLSEQQLESFIPEWHILCIPTFKADPIMDHTRSENFAIINFAEKEIIIGGTGYTGEIKKSIFSVLNYILPVEKDVLSMHCSANEGRDGDIAVFFGLSGTGKTTLSADPERQLIGDDEHGWSNQGVFNFEGGCYAKCIGLSQKKEPQIYNAIKPGAILENIGFKEGSLVPDFDDTRITENTRVSYPIFHIENARTPSLGGHPKNIFFLTCDAFGVLPPVSRLTPGQAMYHFISGYTAKVAGTEDGVNEPQATFSACFGAPFLPLHPTTYAEMLGEKMKIHGSKVWLINTGWIGGSYGQGSRIKLKYTRSIIKAIMNDSLDHVRYGKTHDFNLEYPTFCPGVPSGILNPRNSWRDGRNYDMKSRFLAKLFADNFKEYAKFAGTEIRSAEIKLPMAV